MRPASSSCSSRACISSIKSVRTKPLARRTLRVVDGCGLCRKPLVFGHKEVPVTKLRTMTLDELGRRNYSQATARTYVDAIKAFAAYFHRPPDQLGPDEIRKYQLYLVDRELHPKTIRVQTAALRFFFRKVLRRSLF